MRPKYTAQPIEAPAPQPALQPVPAGRRATMRLATAVASGAILAVLAGSAHAQAPAPGGNTTPPAVAVPAPDPRAGDPTYEQSRRLMQAIEGILQDAAKGRSEARKLPSKDQFMLPPLFSETREDRDRKVREMLDSALGIVTDVPVVDIQKRIEERRKSIRELEEQQVKLRERQLSAPKEALLAGILTDTVDTLQAKIDDAKKRVQSNRDDIRNAKKEVAEALGQSGVKMSDGQVDMLLDSVLSGDLVRLIAVFNSAKAIDAQLGRLMSQSGDNLAAARKYFAMHAALFAMLVQSQNTLIDKIDNQYLPKLDAIAQDVAAARAKTEELLKAQNRPDQSRALQANRDSQKLTDEASKAYRKFLLQQREQLAAARKRSTHDLRIADNTFETVEASFQLRNMMRDSSASFEAIQKLEAPTFEQIFRNEELRREFENLTRKLDAPSS